MKMFTHIVSGSGSVFAFLAALPLDTRFILAVVVSLAVNETIDIFGHTTRGGFVARSPITHSIFTAPLWGALVGYILWRAGTQVGLGGASLEVGVVASGVVAAFTHLVLDSVTERGVFLVRRRFAVAHFGSGNIAVNAVFVLVGLTLFLL